MGRLVDGLALLTDTTEAGMSALAAEIAQSESQGQPCESGDPRHRPAAREGSRAQRRAHFEDAALSPCPRARCGCTWRCRAVNP
jgi:hypothetical protein